MQQRRPRLGDILDDYCPRERRITNHAVVAMIDDQVKQTRCTTCDADHEYKQARIPVRRKKESGALLGDGAVGTPRPRPAVVAPAASDDVAPDSMSPGESADAALPSTPTSHDPAALAASDNHAEETRADDPLDTSRESGDEDGPVHRRLIRATLPRPEGQPPEWKNPDFTIRQPGSGRGGHDPNRNGHRPARGGRRPARAQGDTPGQPTRFGGQRQGQGNARHGSGQPHGQGSNRGGGRPGQGHGPGGQQRGQRPGGPGRKRGR